MHFGREKISKRHYPSLIILLFPLLFTCVLFLSSLSSPASMKGPNGAGLQSSIQEELRKDPFVESERIIVVVEGEVAELRGVVRNTTEKAAALADACQAGADEVRDCLKVPGDLQVFERRRQGEEKEVCHGRLCGGNRKHQ